MTNERPEEQRDDLTADEALESGENPRHDDGSLATDDHFQSGPTGQVGDRGNHDDASR